MQAGEDIGFIAKDVTDMSSSRLDATQDYALAVERDIQTNGLASLLSG